MAGTNDYLPYATGVGANVVDQATYAGAAYVDQGRGSGILPSDVYNKIARQGNFVAAAVGQLIADQGLDALDNGNLTTLVANLLSTIAIIAGEATRTKLAANADYYVATTGNDSHAGAIGTPWLTLQHAWDYVQQNVDLNGYSVTVHVSDGAYTSGVTAYGALVGDGNGRNGGGPGLIFTGNVGSPGNATLTTTNVSCFNAFQGSKFKVRGFQMACSGSGTPNCINASDSGSYVQQDSNIFGSAINAHMSASAGAVVVSTADYAINNGAAVHAIAQYGGSIVLNTSIAVTITGTPTFSTAFADTLTCGTILSITSTFTGSVTGKRYLASSNGVVDTRGGGANYFPGTIAGSTATGGEYV